MQILQVEFRWDKGVTSVEVNFPLPDISGDVVACRIDVKASRVSVERFRSGVTEVSLPPEVSAREFSEMPLKLSASPACRVVLVLKIDDGYEGSGRAFVVVHPRDEAPPPTAYTLGLLPVGR